MTKSGFNLRAVALAACCGALLVGCGGGSDTTTTMEPEPMPPVEDLVASERAAINQAIAAAETAVAAVTDTASDADVMAADDAIAAAKQAIADAENVPEAEKTAHTGRVNGLESQLMGNNASRQMAMEEAERMAMEEAITDAQMELTAAKTALNALPDDATDVQKRDAYRMVEAAANTLVTTLRMNGGSETDIEAAIEERAFAKSEADALDVTITANAEMEEMERMEAINTAQMALTTAEGALEALADDATDEEKRAAQMAVHEAAEELIAVLEANEGSADQIMAAEMKRDAAEMMVSELTMMIDTADQRQAIADASSALATALDDLDDANPTAEQVKAVSDAVMALEEALDAADHLDDDEKNASRPQISIANNAIADANEVIRTAAEAQMEAEQLAMMETARKLYNGIGAPTNATSSVGRLHATYGGTADAATIDVSIGEAAAAISLSEDEEAMLPELYGWEGKRYTASPDSGDMYEAHVYSNVGETTMGNPFDEQYTLTEEGLLSLATGGSGVDIFRSANVASPEFDQSSGAKSFMLPENDVYVSINGSYHGVSGEYQCTPTADSRCAVIVSEGGGFEIGTVNIPTDDTVPVFTSGSGTWNFEPDNAEALVATAPLTTDYSSYGWWLRKSADGETFTASAFVANRGTVPAATDITRLVGTATYEGGAAGKYALYSPTGGTNDSGHFTAKATLEADFGILTTVGTISGTISNFMGADGQPRSWSVELSEATISTGSGNTPADTTTFENLTNGTVWTIDGTAAAASGEWSGSLMDPDTMDDIGTPKVATGTFYSEYAGAGKMVGAFGADKQ